MERVDGRQKDQFERPANERMSTIWQTEIPKDKPHSVFGVHHDLVDEGHDNALHFSLRFYIAV